MLPTLVVMTLLVGLYTGVTLTGIALLWYVTRTNRKDAVRTVLTPEEEAERVAYAQQTLGGAILT